MSWEKLDLHIENLVSGAVSLAVVLIGWPRPAWFSVPQEKLQIVAFIATAYMLGALCDVLARLLLEFVCRKTARRVAINLFLGMQLESLDKANKRLSDAILAGESCGSPRIESEVVRRRQTARLLRLTMFPMWVGWIAYAHHAQWHWFALGLTLIGTYLGVFFLYAYSEIVIMQECIRGEAFIASNKKA